jgi:hypothetical protein
MAIRAMGDKPIRFNAIATVNVPGNIQTSRTGGLSYFQRALLTYNKQQG